jgi:hypothetical protein
LAYSSTLQKFELDEADFVEVDSVDCAAAETAAEKAAAQRPTSVVHECSALLAWDGPVFSK